MNVLVAEDDAVWRDVIRRALAKAGFRAFLAGDGAEAMKLFAENAYDFLITDIFMPEKEGLEVIDEIRRLVPDIRILAISSSGAVGHSSYLRMAEAFGANISLQKPFTAEQLLDAIRIVSRYKPSEIVPQWDRTATNEPANKNPGGRYENQ